MHLQCNSNVNENIGCNWIAYVLSAGADQEGDLRWIRNERNKDEKGVEGSRTVTVNTTKGCERAVKSGEHDEGEILALTPKICQTPGPAVPRMKYRHINNPWV